jgi:hypothetical protein
MIEPRTSPYPAVPLGSRQVKTGSLFIDVPRARDGAIPETRLNLSMAAPKVANQPFRHYSPPGCLLGRRHRHLLGLFLIYYQRRFNGLI